MADNNMNGKNPEENTCDNNSSAQSPAQDAPMQENETIANKTNFVATYMTIGTSVGITLGVAFKNIGLGLCIGTCVGLCIGAALQKQNGKSN